MAMTAVEVLKFIGKTCKSQRICDNCLFHGEHGCITVTLSDLDKNAQEIVDCIEKYEAEKNKKEFKVGDWVLNKTTNMHGKIVEINDIIITMEYPRGEINGVLTDGVESFEHAEPSKEETKGIKQVFITMASHREYILAEKINELVDAVNELRGVK